MTKHNLPCPCGESDRSFSQYEDGGYCHKCRAVLKKDKEGILKKEVSKEDNNYYLSLSKKDTYVYRKDMIKNQVASYQFVSRRSLSEATLRKYDMITALGEDGAVLYHVFPFDNGARVCKTDDKKFWSEGPIQEAGLFGQDKFPAGSARAVTVTTGLEDAAAVYEMLGGYPAVSITSGDGSAKAACTRARDYLNSFEKIYLCFDMDEPGQKAVRQVAELFDFNKVYHVRLPAKDANYMLDNGQVEAFKKAWWSAKRFLPEGIYSTFEEFDRILDEDEVQEGLPLPWESMQEMTNGLQLGEVYLVTAPEGVGKSEVIRRMEYHVFKTAEEIQPGIIHLEEKKADLLKRYAGYEMGIQAHIKDSLVSKDEIKKAYRTVIGRDGRAHVYSHFGSDDPNVILDVVRFLVAAVGCKYVFLDHITMVVTGQKEEDTVKALDYICTRLAMMVKELNFCLVIVAHENDLGQTRGSRMISKIASTWIQLTRDLTNENAYLRNIIHVLFKKNRPVGKTGPGGKLIFNPDTNQLNELREKEVPHE